MKELRQPDWMKGKYRPGRLVDLPFWLEDRIRADTTDIIDWDGTKTDRHFTANKVTVSGTTGRTAILTWYGVGFSEEPLPTEGADICPDAYARLLYEIRRTCT